MGKQSNNLSRSDVIGIVGVLVAVAAIGVGVMTSEIRKLTGLEPSNYPLSVTLKTDYGADYNKLQYLLASGKFKEADIETTHLLLWAANREEEGTLNSESVKRFSCTDLRTIDTLWTQHSNGRFGFSVQTQLWKTGQVDLEEFVSHIGWLNLSARNNEIWVKYNDLIFERRAPIGHLPTGGAFAPKGVWRGEWLPILSNRCF